MIAIRQKDRSVSIAGSGKFVTIPAEAAEAIYRLIKKEYLVEDAKERLFEKFGLGDGYDDEELKENEKFFKNRFGFSSEEACDRESEHYLLERLADMFIDATSESVNNESTWDYVIDHCLGGPNNG